MIKLVPDPTFDALVKLTAPNLLEPVEVPITFRHMTAEQVTAWFKDNSGKQVAEAIDRILTGWTGVMGEDGQLVPYSLQALETLLKNYQPAGNEIIRAWQIGLTESRVKN